MTEADWLKAKNPDAMLTAIRDQLSPRRWRLLACAVVRRTWEFLPEGELRNLLEAIEQQPDSSPTLPDDFPAVVARSVESAVVIQSQLVASAHPELNPDSYLRQDEENPHPSLPLYGAACRRARESLHWAGLALEEAAQGLLGLLELPPGPEMLSMVRGRIVEATRIRSVASLYASSALKLKEQGDEFADQDDGKNASLRGAVAEEIVFQDEQRLGTKQDDFQEQKERMDRKTFGRFLQELVGNPYKPYRFEAAWRTSDVMELARTIHNERLFDRMPLLADALLDADCDEEAILRHCRGTEVHNPDGAGHTRGCWVLDLILGEESAFFSSGPLLKEKAPAPKKAVAKAKKSPDAAGWARLLSALKNDGNLDDEE